jgi:hypothetical protein
LDSTNAVRLGWIVVDELKEPDFHALRRRDDFQKLHKELEKE